MSDLNDFINGTLYPALFDKLDALLPDFNQAGPNKWISPVKLDGTNSGRPDKTAVLRDRPHCMTEWGERAVEILAHIQQRDGIGFAEALQKAATAAGVTVPAKHLTPEQAERARAAAVRSAILETAGEFLNRALYNPSNEWRAGAERAAAEIKRRGYTAAPLLRQPHHDDEAGAERIEAGYLPSVAVLWAYLTDGQRFTAAEIKSALDVPQNAGGRLSIALRERGRLVGFAFRALDDDGPKYLYPAGYDNARRLPGLPRRLDAHGGRLVLVEGVLDQAHAHARGLENVAAVGGSKIHDDQLKRAIDAGARLFYLCLDSDQAGREGTRAALLRLLETRKERPDVAVYVCELPAGCKDLDDVLRQHGAEAARLLFDQAKGAPALWAAELQTWADATAAEIGAGTLAADQRRDQAAARIVQAEGHLPPVDVPAFRRELLKREVYQACALPPAELEVRAEQLRDGIARERYRHQLTDLHKQAAELAKAGKVDEAETLYRDGYAAARSAFQAGKFAELLTPNTAERLREALANRPPSIETSYKLDVDGREVPLKLPAGGLSVFAARPNHGKTPMLVNLALDIAAKDAGEVHFFTYEESAEALTVNALNRYLDRDFAAVGYTGAEALTAWLMGNAAGIKPDQLDAVKAAVSDFFALLENGRLYFHFAEYRAEALADAVRQLHRRRRVAAIVVDYIQLLELEATRKNYSRQEEMKAICNHLKDAARETGLPLVFAAQFSRAVTCEKEMTMDALREAGDIEQTAALVVGLWNRTKDSEPKPEIFAKILKQRGGNPNGAAVWHFNGARYKIGGAALNLTPATNGAGAGISLRPKQK